MNAGDLGQIRALRSIYNQLLYAKETIVSTTCAVKLSVQQLNEIEIRVALVTGELKEIDADIHRLMFKDDETVKECKSLPLFELAKQIVREDFNTNYYNQNKSLRKLKEIIQEKERIILRQHEMMNKK